MFDFLALQICVDYSLYFIFDTSSAMNNYKKSPLRADPILNRTDSSITSSQNIYFTWWISNREIIWLLYSNLIILATSIK